MKGSILFNPDINIEVDVDPAAEEGARLSSAKNLVDGQELGIGGGSDLPEVTSADEGKVLAVNASGEWAAEDIFFKVIESEGTLNKTAGEIDSALRAGKYVFILFNLGDTLVLHKPVTECAIEDGTYNIFALSTNNPELYSAASAEAYPVYVD